MPASTITYVEGDATHPTADGPGIIVHVCNDIGAWGRGFTAALSQRWPTPETEYRRWYRERTNNDFALGAVQLVSVEADLWVGNLVGQRHIVRSLKGPPVRYEAIETGLQTVARQAVERGASVHMPRIGCGLAGGRWERIEPIIDDALLTHGVAVTVYDLPTSH